MAGRIPKPWFRRSKNAWFVTLDGRQVSLGKDKEEALRQFHRLMADQGKAPVEAISTLTAAQLVAMYLTDAERRLQKNTLRVTKGFLHSFANQFGNLLCYEVKRSHVECWIRANPAWSQTTEALAKTRLVTAFRFGVEQGLLASNPLQGIRKPPQRSRGISTLITPQDHVQLMAAAEPHLRNVLFALEQTGARPGEVTSVTAAEFHLEQAVWVLKSHKTAHTGRERIVYLPPPLVELCQQLAQRHPIGPLFRNQWGRPYGWCGVSKRIAWLRKRLGLSGKGMVYAYRHTFATDALANGVPDTHVAELLGHQGTAMLHKHYAHLMAKTKTLQKALQQVRPATGQ